MRRTPARSTLDAHEVWRALRAGKRVTMKVHPSSVGFVREHGLTERRGQVEDWTRSLPDGSRLHAHVMPDGSVVVHRDRWDPARGPVSRVAHVALETTAGRVGLALLAARALGWLP